MDLDSIAKQLFCASVSKICPKVSENLRASKGVLLSIKLDVIKHV